MSDVTLITGAGGFIGSHLVERVARDHAGQVRALVHYNSSNSWGWLEGNPVLKDVEVVTGDIRDYDSVRRCTKGCDTVYHLAALIGIPYSYVSPHAYIDVNVGGTYNVLEAARDAGCRQVLVTSTSETYGTGRTHAMAEDHPQSAQSPYAATKVGADQLALSFHRSFGLPVKIVRPFNTFGPRQSARAIIPATIAQLFAGERRVRVGNVSPTRDLTYVLDTVEAFVKIADCHGLVGEVTNIGRNEETSVGDLVALIARLMGKAIEVDVDPARVRDEKTEVQRLRCDNRKLLDSTGWRPRYSLEDGLTHTIDWFRSNAHLYKAALYNV